MAINFIEEAVTETNNKRPANEPIDIIIPLLDRPELRSIQLKCLNSVKENTTVSHTLTIVISDVKDIQWLKDWANDYPTTCTPKDVKIIEKPERVGLNQAINIGVRDTDNEYICILCGDIKVYKHWLKLMRETLEIDSKLFGWVSGTLIEDEELENPSPEQPFVRLIPFNLSMSLLTRTSFLKLGTMDTEFDKGNSFEDDDLFMRYYMAGYRPHGCSEAIGIHLGPQSSFKSTFSEEERAMRYFRNSSRFYKKWMLWSANLGNLPFIQLFADRYDWMRYHAEGSIVDIGCAGGMTFGDKATNVDVDKYDCPNFVRSKAEELPFPDNNFDTACLGDVLEHVKDPVVVIREARRVARRQVLISVPRENDDKIILKKDKPDLYEKEYDHWIRDNKPKDVTNDDEFPHLLHRRIYRHKLLIDQLKEAGFTKFEIRPVIKRYYQGYFVRAIC